MRERERVYIKTFVMGLAKWLSGRVLGKHGQGPWLNVQHQNTEGKENRRKTNKCHQNKTNPHGKIF